MVKLEYSRYNAKIKYEWVCNSTQSSDLLCYTNGCHECFVEFCVIEVQVLGYLTMDEGIRSKKILSLGIDTPWHTKPLSKEEESN